MPTVLFVSDLHLSPVRPEKTALFIKLMREAPARVGSVYILGDIFEFSWRDDDYSEPIPAVFAAIAEAVDSGLPVYFMNGNREFYLGYGLMARSGMGLLPDPFVLSLDGVRTVLSHGDMLCTGDKSYLRFRRFCASSFARRVASMLPAGLFHILSASHRRRTDGAGRRGYGDVDVGAVEELMLARDAQVMVHGHIHDRGMRVHSTGGRTVARYVLGDWIDGDTVLLYQGGSFSYCRASEW